MRGGSGVEPLARKGRGGNREWDALFCHTFSSFQTPLLYSPLLQCTLSLSTLYISCSYFVAYLNSMSPLYSHIHSLSDFSSKLNGFASKSVRIRQNSKYSNGFRCYCDVSHSQQTSPENSPTSVTVK